MTEAILRLISHAAIHIAADSHVFLCVVRNEILRLPYLLKYYRQLGFDSFIFIDNNSNDGTREYLLAQRDIYVLHTEARFGDGPGAGVRWKNKVLDQFCCGRWILCADADELLIWPGSERETIRSLSKRMAAEDSEVFFVVMVDMYSDRPFGRIGYQQGMPFTNSCPYFDGGPYTLMPATPFPYRQIDGGVRARLYKQEGTPFPAPVMSKVPFLRWKPDQRFIVAQHALQLPGRLASTQGALLHFKMFDDLPGKCEIEIQRGEYYAQGREYRVLGEIIQKSPTKSFYDPLISVRYKDTEQLRSIGLIGPLLRLPEPAAG